MKALITGASGFMGQRLTEKLISLNYTVRILVRKKERMPAALREKCEVVLGDITIPETISGCCQDIDIVFNLAALMGHDSPSEDAFARFRKVNVEGLRNIVYEVERCNVKRFIHVSSTAAMGLLKDKLVDEAKGNFQCLLKTIEGLKTLEKKYDNFHLELGTVISNFNIDDLDEIEDFVHSLGVESYRNEVAECRTEFFNLQDPITPPADVYQKLIKDFSRKVEENIGKKKRLARTTEAMRVVYYDLAGRILKENRQVIPCYAGISNVHINYDGGVWPCCVLGYDHEMGNLRDFNYDFQKLWHSPKAYEVRKYIKARNCACPLANQAYSNELMHLPTLVRAGIKSIKFSLK